MRRRGRILRIYSVSGHYNWYCKKCWKQGKVQLWHGADVRKHINMQSLHSCPSGGNAQDMVFIPV